MTRKVTRRPARRSPRGARPAPRRAASSPVAGYHFVFREAELEALVAGRMPRRLVHYARACLMPLAEWCTRKREGTDGTR
jgi:hypothetical protein